MTDRVTGLLEANNRAVEKRRAATALLREAGELFRMYEASHRAKLVPEDGSHTTWLINTAIWDKVERNAEIADRIETFLKEIHQ